MNSADVFSLEFDMLTRTSALAKTLEWFRGNALGAATHRQLLLELNHVINVHSRLREVAADVVPPEDWSAWQELLAVPALAFDQGRAFLDDLRSLGLNSLDSVSLTPLPQTIAMAAYAHYQLVERATVGLVGYLWFFERMPRLVYPLWNEACRRGGVADKALRALAQGAVRRSGARHAGRQLLPADRAPAARPGSRHARACTTRPSCSRPWWTRPLQRAERRQRAGGRSIRGLARCAAIRTRSRQRIRAGDRAITMRA